MIASNVGTTEFCDTNAEVEVEAELFLEKTDQEDGAIVMIIFGYTNLMTNVSLSLKGDDRQKEKRMEQISTLLYSVIS